MLQSVLCMFYYSHWPNFYVLLVTCSGWQDKQTHCSLKLATHSNIYYEPTKANFKLVVWGCHRVWSRLDWVGRCGDWINDLQKSYDNFIKYFIYEAYPIHLQRLFVRAFYLYLWLWDCELDFFSKIGWTRQSMTFLRSTAGSRVSSVSRTQGFPWISKGFCFGKKLYKIYGWIC